jgi:hypothetical protein
MFRQIEIETGWVFLQMHKLGFGQALPVFKLGDLSRRWVI